MPIWKRKKQKDEVTIEEIQGYLDELVELGFIEIAGYDKNGEARYAATEIGRLELEAIKP